MPSNRGSSPSRLAICQGTSLRTDPILAVKEVSAQLQQQENSLTLVFCSDTYDNQQLSEAIQQHILGPVIGCTTAGQICSTGFQKGGLCALSLASSAFQAIPYLISPLSSASDQINSIAQDVQARLQGGSYRAFGILLIDGLSSREEELIDKFYRGLGDVPIIGGSAGDMLKFQQTFVYHQGKFLQDAAVFTLCLTSLPFLPFKHQHFLPTSKRLVITEAEPELRLVREINGEPASQAYARIVGVQVEQLDAKIFSRHPLMLKFHDDYYVRSIAEVIDNGSLKLYCAIDRGVVLTIGSGQAPDQALLDQFTEIQNRIGKPAVILGCDCILRRLEMEDLGVADEIGRIFQMNNVFGFSTYGEQYGSLHVNQTFTGIAIAG